MTLRLAFSRYRWAIPQRHHVLALDRHHLGWCIWAAARAIEGSASLLCGARCAGTGDAGREHPSDSSDAPSIQRRGVGYGGSEADTITYKGARIFYKKIVADFG